MVDVDNAALRRIAAGLMERKIPVEAVYLLRTTSQEGHVDWVVRVVTPAKPLDAVYALARLRREGKVPALDDAVRMSSIAPDSYEATVILDYAARAFSRPVEIRGTPLGGIFIEYALVADLTDLDRAAA